MKFEFDYQCDKDWDEMKGGDRRRFCDSCEQNVHHISGMSKDKAVKFLEDRNWDVCVDFFTDAEGNTEFREEGKLAMQLDGLKQVVASALAIVPLALAAAFIDFDKEAPAEIVSTQTFSPIELGGPTPVIVDTTPRFVPPAPFRPNGPPAEPMIQEIPEPVVIEEVELPPLIEEIPQPEPTPAVIDHRPRLRGKIARPDWAHYSD